MLACFRRAHPPRNSTAGKTADRPRHALAIRRREPGLTTRPGSAGSPRRFPPTWTTPTPPGAAHGTGASVASAGFARIDTGLSVQFPSASHLRSGEIRGAMDRFNADEATWTIRHRRKPPAHTAYPSLAAAVFRGSRPVPGGSRWDIPPGGNEFRRDLSKLMREHNIPAVPRYRVQLQRLGSENDTPRKICDRRSPTAKTTASKPPTNEATSSTGAQLCNMGRHLHSQTACSASSPNR